MKFLAIAVAVVMSFGSLVCADELPKEPKFGRQRITEIRQPKDTKAPSVKQEGKLKPGEAKGTKLKSKDWVCGRCFTDEEGRRWRLTSGLPHNEKPADLPGWLIRDKNGRLSFMTNKGSLYRPGSDIVPRQSQYDQYPRVNGLRIPQNPFAPGTVIRDRFVP
ncbi:MAG: hypothetical protein ACFCD0_16905 [Gemmataceae bacterium]